MEAIYQFVKLEKSEALQEFAQKKLDKLFKFQRKTRIIILTVLFLSINVEGQIILDI